MTSLCCNVIFRLQGKTLVTAESCTGGGIGEALTSVSGASAVFKGGIISYTNEVKHNVLGVPMRMLEQYGAVSAPVAEAMARGARELLRGDIAVSVTGLAGPGADDFGNAVGTVFIGYADQYKAMVKEFRFSGDRNDVRSQAVEAALQLVLEMN